MRGVRLASGLLKGLDHRLGRMLGPARVLVDVRTPMNLEVLRPVWAAFVSDSRIRVTFTADDTGSVAAVLGERRAGLLPRQHARWKRFDLAVTADLWSDAPLRRCRRRVNFFHGVAGKYDLDDPARLPGADLRRFDRLAFINEDRRDRYVRAGVIDPRQAVVVGFPKLDGLVNGRWLAPQIRRELGLDPSLATVLYAPTFSTANSLHAAGDTLIEALLSTGCNVVVKLHDRSLAPSAQYTDGIDWPARLRRFRRERRFALAHGADSSPYLAAADVLVTDHSTVGFEFAVLDRPIVVLDTPALKAAARIDDEKWRLLRSMSDIAADVTSLAQVVMRALEAPSRLSGERRKARRLFAHAGSATKRALDLVYELLDLPPLHEHEVLRRHRYA